MSKPTVEIQYCVPCGHLPRALDIQKSLLEHFGQKIEGVTLKTGDSGIFTIDVNGERIYARPDEFDLDAVTKQVSDRL